MVEDFRPPRPTDASTRWLVKSVNDIKPDQVGNVELAVGDLTNVDTSGDPQDGDTFIYNSTTQVFEVGHRPSAVDEFTITDDATSTFALSHRPVTGSWNVSMGWPFGESRFTISGSTLTIPDPTDTFRGVAANGNRTLRVQYDYLDVAAGPFVVTSPFAYYRFLETSGTTAADSSGNSRDMSIVGSAHTFDQPGPILKSIEWSTAAGSTLTSSQHSHSTSSVECWVKLAAYPSADTGVIGHAQGGAGSTTHDKNLYITTAGKVRWYVFNGAVQILESTAALELGVWHLLAASVGAGGTKLYVDGAVVAADAAVISSYTGGPQNLILRGGGTAAGGAPATLGTGAMFMAEAVFYDVQIADAYVAEHWAALA